MVDYGVKISREGYDITDGDYRHLAFISDAYGNILKARYQGTTTVTIENGETSGYTDIGHDLGYFPGAYAFVETSGNKKLRCNFFKFYDHTDGYTGNLSISDSSIRVAVKRSGSAGEVALNVYYYIFIDDTNIT